LFVRLCPSVSVKLRVLLAVSERIDWGLSIPRLRVGPPARAPKCGGRSLFRPTHCSNRALCGDRARIRRVLTRALFAALGEGVGCSAQVGRDGAKLPAQPFATLPACAEPGVNVREVLGDSIDFAMRSLTCTSHPPPVEEAAASPKFSA